MRSTLLAGLAITLWAGGSGDPAYAASCPAATTEALEIRGSTLCVAMGDPAPGRREILHAWVERSARIVAQYYGRFPAALVLIELDDRPGEGVGGGRTTNDGGLAIRVNVGSDATAERLANDWVLVHEMVHLALPEVGRAHNWLAEGLAVYVEGVARAQFGNRDVADVWAEDRRSMPMGLPREGEGGMDQTSSWGRTYWGGALFCLVADVQIRRETQNRKGLQDALRAVVAARGTIEYDWSLDKALAIGDKATGTRVLTRMYAEWKDKPVTVDLDKLWEELGVRAQPGGAIEFVATAPLAGVREAITGGPAEARHVAAQSGRQ